MLFQATILLLYELFLGWGLVLALSRKHIPDFFLERHKVRTSSTAARSLGMDLEVARGPRNFWAFIQYSGFAWFCREDGGRVNFLHYGSNFFITVAIFCITGRPYWTQEQLSLRLEQLPWLRHSLTEWTTSLDYGSMFLYYWRTCLHIPQEQPSSRYRNNFYYYGIHIFLDLYGVWLSGSAKLADFVDE